VGAKAYGVDKSKEEVKDIIKDWRERHPKIVGFWRDLNNASLQAALNPGEKFIAGAKGREITYLKRGSFLWCKLPSNRVICYPYPQVKEELIKWEGQVWTKDTLSYSWVNSQNQKWERRKAYGGLLAENCTQAVARDKLVDRMLALEEEEYTIVKHVHDEVVCEEDYSFGSLKEVCDIMTRSDTWDEGLPIAATGWEGTRYRKE
jgi:DNA polymerase